MFWRNRLPDFVQRLTRYDLPLAISLWDGTRFALGHDPGVTLHIRDSIGLTRLLRPSLDRLGEAYVEGHIDVEGPLHTLIDGATRLASHALAPTGRYGRIRHMVRHSRKVDADAIAYHYDVANDFYRLWLDQEMIYSCAYFNRPNDTLEAAQVAKLDHILTKIRLRPGDRLLDIGCGWGALILRAVEKYGATAVGITLSQQQYELAKERIARAGLANRCEVHLTDYRDMTGKFDRITSIGMFEHVGLKHLRGYFTTLRHLLKDDGIVLNHGITSTDPESGETPWGGGRFIDRYVFPNGELPHISLALRELEAAGLETADVENLRRHYALTLDHWAQRFEANAEAIRRIAGEKRYRIWRVYLAGCAHGFRHGWMAIHQILATPYGHASSLPLTRNWMYAG
ncbi:cyclopropane fatty acyl phospholipid synthase [Oryzomicrobium terrae]|uniref:Cyclopropane fatty acyl phospholipid synthase n=1 Tax=Oryzomicrobium terrae TaxID=1735038 RepID=A0A5C1E8E9_9RHOO|nr:cyclopropane-fatty-acyl-phospholipid synthase family protein [Oryzomicrobium terrae]QEL64915.1 cyclopropane fatty acyl phospholipid synthase [Oryzomicrobium terrae]